MSGNRLGLHRNVKHLPHYRNSWGGLQNIVLNVAKCDRDHEIFQGDLWFNPLLAVVSNY